MISKCDFQRTNAIQSSVESSEWRLHQFCFVYFINSINKQNIACSKCQTKESAHQAKFSENFPKHFFLLFEKKQFNFQMKYSKLVDRQIKRQENLNLSFCGHL